MPPSTRVGLVELLLREWSASTSSAPLEIDDCDPTDGSTLLHALVASATLPYQPPDQPCPPANTSARSTLGADAALGAAAGAAALSSELTRASFGTLEEPPSVHREASEAIVQLAEMLVGAGARVNATSHAGNTPLHVACAAGPRMSILEPLVAARADVNALNRQRESPLHLLAVSPALEAPPSRERSQPPLPSRDRLEWLTSS